MCLGTNDPVTVTHTFYDLKITGQVAVDTS